MERFIFCTAATPPFRCCFGQPSALCAKHSNSDSAEDLVLSPNFEIAKGARAEHAHTNKSPGGRPGLLPFTLARDQKRKLKPPRTTCKVVGSKRAVNESRLPATGKLLRPRSMYRYSARIVQFRDSPYSAPPPAVQPVAVRVDVPE